MDPDRLARRGLCLFAAGNLAWMAANLSNAQPNPVNAVTDAVVVAGAILAAAGLSAAIDGFGAGRLKAGLLLVAGLELAQNVVTAARGITAARAAPVAVVIAASALLGIGALRWRAGWDRAAAGLAALGFLGLAFEPVYYFVRGLPTVLNPFFPGALCVACGGLMVARAFRPGAAAIVDGLSEAAADVLRRLGRAAG